MARRDREQPLSIGCAASRPNIPAGLSGNVRIESATRSPSFYKVRILQRVAVPHHPWMLSIPSSPARRGGGVIYISTCMGRLPKGQRAGVRHTDRQIQLPHFSWMYRTKTGRYQVFGAPGSCRLVYGHEEHAHLSRQVPRPTGRPPLPLNPLHQEPSSRAFFSRAKHSPGFTPTSPGAQRWAVKGCRCTPRDEPPGKQEEPDTTMRTSGTGPCRYGTLDSIGPALQRAARVEERDEDQWMGLF